MRVAVPVFRGEVSPRFGYSGELVVADVDGGNVKMVSRGSLAVSRGGELFSLIMSQKPDMVICGGIHPSWQMSLERNNVQVIWGVIGSVDEALEAFAAGRLASNQFVCQGRRGRGNRRSGRRGRRR